MKRILAVIMILMFFVVPQRAEPQLFVSQQKLDQAVNSYLDDAVTILEGLEASNWADFVNPWDDQLYFSVAGGLAGLGLDLIELVTFSDLNTSIDDPFKDRVLTLAQKIADDLQGFAAVDNESTIIWTVHDNTSSVDLGYDFGIAGIASFYSQLAAVTGNATYTDVAFRALSAIDSLADHQTGISWLTTLDYFDENLWYGFGDFFVDAMDNATYVGRAFGPIGLGMAVLDYLAAPSSNASFGNSILEEVMTFLNNSKVTANNWSAYPIILSRPDVISNSLAMGMSGVGLFLHRYLQYSSMQSVNSTLSEVINWFFLNDTSGQRLYLSSSYSDTVDFRGFWVGKDLGIAGNLRFLSSVSEFLNEDQMDEMRQFRIYLSLFAKRDGGGLVFPERVEDNVPLDYSPVNAYGTAGIVEVFISADPALNNSYILDQLEEYRAGILLSSDNLTSGLYYEVMGDYGFASAVGLSGVLLMFVPDAVANIRFSTNSIDFGHFPLDSPASETVRISNKGTVSAVVSLVNISAPITSNFSQATLHPGETIYVSFTANPENESSFTTFATFSIDDKIFYSITFQGRGVDNPVIDLVSPANGSTLSEKTTLKFKVTDSSTIKNVKLSIKNQEGVVLQNDLSGEGDIYSYVWDIQKWVNGTFTVVVTATDVNDFSTTNTYAFTVLNIVGRPTDFFGSDTFFYGLLALIAVVVLSAVAITIKIRRAS